MFGKVKFYYGREKETNHPRVAVCLIEMDGVVCRGMAVCSPSEPQINRKRARSLAKGRALRAYYLARTDLPIQRAEAMDVLRACNMWYLRKSEYDCLLSVFERKILGLS